MEDKDRKGKKMVKSSKSILLVDDEDMIIEVGKQMLEMLGYQVIPCSSGYAAVEVYRKKRDEIDMVVLDMIMPGMGGGETFLKLKEIDPDVKVLLSSGYSLDRESEKVLEQGCSGFIQKPFKIDDLSKQIKTILET